MADRNMKQYQGNKMTLPNWDTFSNNMINYGVGITEVPAEFVNYSGLGANWVANKLGLRNDLEAKLAAQAIQNQTNKLRPSNYLPPEYNNQYSTTMRNMGNVAGDVLLGKAALNPVYHQGFLDKTPQLVSTLKDYGKHTPKYAAIGTGKEVILEPYLDNTTK